MATKLSEITSGGAQLATDQLVAVRAGADVLVTGRYSQGLFADKPSAASGLLHYATDLGATGVLLVSNGAIWKPATGGAVIYQTGAQSTLHTGDTLETNLATLTIPAGLLSPKGALRLTVHAAATGTAGVKTMKAYYSATAGSNNGTIFGNNQLAASNISAVIQKTLTNRDSAGSQVTSSTGQFGTGVSSAAAVATAINTANPSYINLTGTLANGGDAIGYDAITLEWLEP